MSRNYSNSNNYRNRRFSRGNSYNRGTSYTRGSSNVYHNRRDRSPRRDYADRSPRRDYIERSPRRDRYNDEHVSRRDRATEITNGQRQSGTESNDAMVQSVLQSLADAIKNVNARLDKMDEKLEAKSIQSHNRSPAPGPSRADNRERNSPPPRSSSDDGRKRKATLGKRLYQSVQLQHHLHNWTNVPKSVQRRIDELLHFICPPVGDSIEFRHALADVGIAFCEGVRAAVRTHCQYELDRLITEFNNSLVTDIDEAKVIARRYARDNKRISAEDFNLHIGAVIPTIGNRPVPSPIQTINKTGQASTSASPSTATLINKPLTTLTVDGPQPTQQRSLPTGDDMDWLASSPQRKRPAPKRKGITPTQPVNKSPVLEILSSDAESSVSIQQTKKKPRNALYHTLPNGVLTFMGSKSDWTLPDLDDIKLLVLGDSNLRRASKIPSNLNVALLSGANLSHVIDAIGRLDPLDNAPPIDVAIQIGINNRDASSDDLQRSIDKLLNRLQHTERLNNCFYVGISVPDSLPDHQRAQVASINQDMQRFFGDLNYIPPIPSSEVEILTNDRDGIHHTTATIDKILASISGFYAGFSQGSHSPTGSG